MKSALICALSILLFGYSSAQLVNCPAYPTVANFNMNSVNIPSIRHWTDFALKPRNKTESQYLYLDQLSFISIHFDSFIFILKTACFNTSFKKT